MDFGEQIRARRLAMGLSLEALAERSGVSRAMLSDVERGLKSPTIRVACQIAEGLACTVSELLGEQVAEGADAVTIVRQAEQQTLIDPHSGVERHLLSPALVRRGIEVIWYVIPPAQRTGAFPPHQPGVEEQITVVQGRLHCLLGTREVLLETGDSAFFPADVTHGFFNPDPEPCQYLLIIDSSRAGKTPTVAPIAGRREKQQA